jgi:hypothetical protein
MVARIQIVDLPSRGSNPFVDTLGPEVSRAVSDYEGWFNSPSGDSIRFGREGSSLAVTEPSPAVQLEARGADAFYTTDPGFDRYPFHFERDGGGGVVAVSHGPAWFFNRAYRGPTEFDVSASWQAVTGRYRSWSPWLPYFEVIVRTGRLILVTGEGGESSSGETPLTEESPGVFRIGAAPTPERLRFHDVVEGVALRADWSGHVFYRVNR